MKNAKKPPINFKLDFNQTNIKELGKKLLSGEITLEEFDKALRRNSELLNS